MEPATTTAPENLEELFQALARRLANTARVLTAWGQAATSANDGDRTRKRLADAAELIDRAVGALTGTEPATNRVPDSPQSASAGASEDGVFGLRGTSEMISLVEFVGFLATLNRDGVLQAQAPNEEFVLQIEGGALVFATGNTPRGLRLGELLTSDGVVSQEQIVDARERMRPDEFLGEALVRFGLADQAAIEAALTEQITQMFCRMHAVGTGFHFQFEEGTQYFFGSTLRLNISHLLLESARLRDQAEAAGGTAPATVGDAVAAALGETDVDPAIYRRHIAAAIDGSKLSLPALPSSTGQLLSMCWQEEIDAAELARCASGDQALCAHLLRVANSVLYSPNEPIQSAQLAITRLGVGKIREIALALTLDQEVFHVPGQEDEVRGLWRTAAVTAGFATHLGARVLGSSARGSLLGLLQDIGKPIVLGTIQELARERGESPNRATTTRLVEEFHAAAGVRLAREWALPDWLCSVIEHHHDFENAGDERIEATVACVSYQLALWAQGLAYQDPNELLGPAWTQLGLAPDDLQTFEACREQVLEQAKLYG